MTDDAAIADPQSQAPAAGDDLDREEAITEILAELRGEPEADAPPQEPHAEPPPLPEPLGDAPPESEGVEQDETPATVAGPPAGEPTFSPAPRQRQASQAGPRLLPLASMPHTLILLNAVFLLLVGALAWTVYQGMSRALDSVAAELSRRAAEPQPRPASPKALSASPARAGAQPARAGEPEPVLQIDEGLRYTQEMEKADLLFEKEDYRAAAPAYRRALAVMPSGWNDGAGAFRLGECCFRLQDYPQAIAAYRQVDLAFPSRYQAQALFQLGEAHLRLKAYREAREAFYSLLLRQGRFGPETAGLIEEAHYRLADAYWLETEGMANEDKEGKP